MKMWFRVDPADMNEMREIYQKYLAIYDDLSTVQFEENIIKKNTTSTAFCIDTDNVIYTDFQKWLSPKQIIKMEENIENNTNRIPILPRYEKYSNILSGIEECVDCYFKDIHYKMTADVCSISSKNIDENYIIILELTDTLEGNDRINVYCNKDTIYYEKDAETGKINRLLPQEIKKHILDKRVNIEGTISFYSPFAKIQIIATKICILPIDSKFKEQLNIWNEEIQGLHLQKEDNTQRQEIKSFNNIGIISSEGYGYEDFKRNIEKTIKNKIKITPKLGLSLNKMISSIKEFNTENNVDCICIVRGGGDKYTFLDFYNPLLIKAMIESKIPILTGIGHELNNPYCCDFSFYNQGTPTALANYFIKLNNKRLVQQTNEKINNLSKENESLKNTVNKLKQTISDLKTHNKKLTDKNNVLQKNNKAQLDKIKALKTFTNKMSTILAEEYV